MKLVLHGIFARDYGPEIVINASSAADALEGFSRQVGFYADRLIEDRPLARVLGYDSEEALRAPLSNETVLHLVPAMFGGGGNFGKIIIGAILIGLSFIPGIGQAAQIALLSAGIGMAVTGVMGFFVKAPSISKDKDPNASKYLGGAEVTTAIGTLWPYCLGTVKLGGYLLSYDVTSNSLTTGVFPTSPT